MASFQINNTNDYSYLFKNLTTNHSASSSFFALSNQYSVSKSGMYKNMLKEYYSLQKADSADATEKQTDTNRRPATVSGTGNQTVSEGLMAAKSDAQALASSTAKLTDSSFYRGKVDAQGMKQVDTEQITGAVKSFVKSYNSMLDSAKDSGVNGIERRRITAMTDTAKSASALQSIGINVGKDGELSIDESVLSATSANDIKKVFVGQQSYGDKIDTTAKEMANLTNSASYQGVGYNMTGAYEAAGSLNSIMNQLF